MTVSAKSILFGVRGQVITPSDSADISTVCKVEVIDAGGGNLSVVPAKNADGQTIDYVGVTVGFTPKFEVRRVMSTGTDCTVVTIEP